ncbi:hypothetical protein CASFOL_031572 [Castilleja foliolosa]|uniref:Ubiquitin-like protease family profile domain-containing protein n=1 Tax=Castilleja foliolosa TaxID=1961234 RepID=A0ABD3C629_9LAMI
MVKKARSNDDPGLHKYEEYHTPPEEAPQLRGEEEKHEETHEAAPEAVGGGDSDFETPPRAQKVVDVRGKGKVKKATTDKSKKPVVENQEKSIIYPKLRYRNSPGVLGEAFSRMNQLQRASVDAMGYGRLEHMKIQELPITLAYWLLENFDVKSSVIKLQNGRELRIEDDDAEIVLGVPNGTKPIIRQCKKDVHPLITEFRGKFPIGMSITAPMVMEKMLGLDARDVWFRRLFLIMMKTVLVECLGNGYVSTQTIPNFENVDDARNLNWGKYMKRCLVDSVLRWQEKKTNPFGGPIVLLLGLYVDRVELLTGSVVPRAFPSIKGWTSKLLKKREEDEKMCEGFGHGYPIARWDGLKDAMKQQASATDVGGSGDSDEEGIREAQLDDDDDRNDEEGASKDKEEHAAQAFAEKFLKKSKLVADTMTELIGMVKTAPMNIMNNIHFKDVFGKTEELLGCKIPMPPAETMPVDDGFTGTQADDEFFANPEIMAIIEEIFRAVEERNKHKSDDGSTAVEERNKQKSDDFGAPDFGLGMTQDYKEFAARRDKRRNENLNDTAPAKQRVESDLQGGSHPSPEMEEMEAEKDDAGHGESHPSPAVDEMEPEKNDADKEESHPPPAVEEVEPAEVQRKKNDDVVEGKSDPKPAVDGCENVEEGQTDVEILSVKKTKVPGRKRLYRRQPIQPQIGHDQANKQVPEQPAKKVGKRELTARKSVTPPEKMPTRTKEEKSLPQSLLSPYKVRTIDPSAKLTQLQRELCYWVMNNNGLNSLHEVFSNGCGDVLNRYDLCTLAYGEWLSNNLVDTWCVILNHNEQYAAPTSPNRFFASTRTTLFTIVKPSPQLDMNARQRIFNEKMKAEIDKYGQVQLDAVDMFLFPILHSGHFYVVSFNVKNFKIEILDNSSNQDDEPLATKYDIIPLTLQAFLVNFLRESNLGQWANSFKKMDSIERLKLPWRDGENFIDCGVFAMRHMETYTGQTLKNYKCGLTAKNSDKQLKMLRIKYCAAILSDDCNVLNDQNLPAARAYYKRKVKDNGIPSNEDLLLTELEYEAQS